MSYQFAIIKKITTATNPATPFTDSETPSPAPATLVGSPALSSSSYSVAGNVVTVYYSLSQSYKDSGNHQWGNYCNGSTDITISDLCTAVTPVTVTPHISATSAINGANIVYTISISIDYNKCAESLQQVEMI